MKSILAAAAIGAALGLSAADAQAQAADSAFDAFKGACMTTGAETAAVSKATETGWKNGGPAGTPIPGFAVDSKVSRTRKVGDADLTLFAWHGVSPKGFTADECQLEISKVSGPALQAAAAAALGFTPQVQQEGKSVFQFAGPPDSPKATASPADQNAAASAGGFFMLTVDTHGKGGFVELLRLHK